MLQAKDLLTNGLCYDALKKALRIKQISIENTADQRSSMVMVSLKPEPIPLDVKVILIGDESIYQTLLMMDSDFRKLFKIKVEFEEDATLNDENINNLARFIHGYCEQEGLPHLDKSAVAKMIEYSVKVSEDRGKLSTKFNDLAEIIGEACTWAKMDRQKVVSGKYIDLALKEQIERVRKYDSRYVEMIEDNSLLIQTNGSKIGEINGLTVMNIGGYAFGKPVKITANTYVGENKIINIAFSGSESPCIPV